MITTTPVGLGFSGIATGASIGGNTDGLTSAEKFEAQQAQIARFVRQALTLENHRYHT